MQKLAATTAELNATKAELSAAKYTPTPGAHAEAAEQLAQVRARG